MKNKILIIISGIISSLIIIMHVASILYYLQNKLYGINIFIHALITVVIVILNYFLIIKKLYSFLTLLAFLSYSFLIASQTLKLVTNSNYISLTFLFLFAITFTLFHTLNIVNKKHHIFSKKL